MPAERSPSGLASQQARAVPAPATSLFGGPGLGTWLPGPPCPLLERLPEASPAVPAPALLGSPAAVSGPCLPAPGTSSPPQGPSRPGVSAHLARARPPHHPRLPFLEGRVWVSRTDRRTDEGRGSRGAGWGARGHAMSDLVAEISREAKLGVGAEAPPPSPRAPGHRSEPALLLQSWHPAHSRCSRKVWWRMTAWPGPSHGPAHVLMAAGDQVSTGGGLDRGGGIRPCVENGVTEGLEAGDGAAAEGALGAVSRPPGDRVGGALGTQAPAASLSL